VLLEALGGTVSWAVDGLAGLVDKDKNGTKKQCLEISGAASTI
jgi:hypothetical protein